MLVILAVDNFLPTEQIETRLYPMTSHQADGRIFYFVPMSGGVMDSCMVEKDVLRGLSSGDEIIVERSALFDRCVSIKKISDDELKCKVGVFADELHRAIMFDQQRNIQAAHAIYSKLCDSYSQHNQKLDPCTESLRLNKRIHQAYDETMSLLSEYRRINGKYPIALEDISDQLTTAAREVAKGFVYCRKDKPSDRTGTCSDGSSSYADGEVAIVTGLYGASYFDIDGRTNLPQLKACRRRPIP